MTDPELQAMQAVLAALHPLEDDARERVVRWAVGRLGIALAFGGKQGARLAEATDNDGDGAAATYASAATSFDTLGDLFAAADPKTNGQKALVVGYWLQTREGLADLDSQRINTELKHLGYGIPNITAALDELKAVKPNLAVQLRKAGTTRQARKKYKITEAGIRAVERMLKGEE